MSRFTKTRKGFYLKYFNRLLQKWVLVPIQQYYTGAYMEETVHDITTKIRGKKLMKTTDKCAVSGSFN